MEPQNVRNVPAQGRIAKRVARSRELVEKNNLKNRSFGHVRHNVDSPFAIQSDSPLHLSDAERLHTDTVGQLKKARHSAIQKQELKIEHKKQRRDEREQNLRQQEAEAKAAEAERHARFRASGLKAKRNKESEPFDLITLRYKDGLDGDRLRHEDASIMYRAEVRKANLQRKMDGEFHPITGQPLNRVVVPQRPSTPQQLQQWRSQQQARQQHDAPPPHSLRAAHHRNQQNGTVAAAGAGAGASQQQSSSVFVPAASAMLSGGAGSVVR